MDDVEKKKAGARERSNRLRDRRATWHRVDTKVPTKEQAAILYALAGDMRKGKPYDLGAAVETVVGADAVAGLMSDMEGERQQLLDRFLRILDQAGAQDLEKIGRKLEVIEIVTAGPPAKTGR